ncbi:MAG: hypothetical protein INR65_16535, partial [Gluconacetobacter diazotrophicus]|nr:hypothetical protein [Gluconacetobacter diazotrophicus]
MKASRRSLLPTAVVICLLAAGPCRAQQQASATVTVDTSPAGRQQTVDGFGTCLSGAEGQQDWWQSLYFDDLRCSLLRVDLTPQFVSPYADFTYNSPWFHNHPALPGPDGNNARVYTSAADYTRAWTFSVNGQDVTQQAQIAVMGPDIDQNVALFDFGGLQTAGVVAQAGQARRARLGDFKLFGSLWSPAPWVKVSSGNTISGYGWPLPADGTAWPFVWAGNFAGGRLDTSDVPLPAFDDSKLGGTGPTSALTQFARCTAAYLRGFQNRYGVKFYAVSVQNELNFEEFYNSCTYPLSSQYLAALKRLRAELDKYPDLAGIRIEGPEDLLGGDAYALWQYGSGASAVHKNLQYLQNVAADPQAAAALDFVSIHGYAPDGVNSAGADPTSWNWWANGWTTSPAAGIPANVPGFAGYGKKSWMTETSGEDPAWLSPAGGFPNNGAFSIALKLHQALTAGRESGWAYWQFTDGNAVGTQTLTDATALATSPKYAAVKHFFACVRPGAVRVNASVSTAAGPPLLASAYVQDADYSLTVVLVNPSASAVSATVAVPAYPQGLGSFQGYTSSDGSYWQNAKVSVQDGQAAVSVPGYGVVTLYGVGLNA